MHGDSPSSHVASQWQTIFQMVAIYYVAVLWFKDCVLGVWQDVLAHEYLGVGTWFKQVGLVPGAGIDEELRWPAIIGAAGVHTGIALLGVVMGNSLKRIKNVFTGFLLGIVTTAVYAFAAFHLMTFTYEENYMGTRFFAKAFHYPTGISDASFYFGALATMHMTLWFGTAMAFASLDKEDHGVAPAVIARYLPRVAMFYLASMVFFRFGCVPLWNYCCRFSFLLEGMFGSTLSEAIITQPDAFSKLASGTHTLTLVLGIVTCSVMNKVLYAIPCGRDGHQRKRKWNLTVLFTLITLFSTVFFQWVSFALRERVEHVVSFATIFAGEEAVSQAATALWSPVHTLVLGSYLSWFCFGVLFEQTWSDSATNREVKEEGQLEGTMPVIPITAIGFLSIFVAMPAAWIGGTVGFFIFIVLMWPAAKREVRKSVIPPRQPFGSYLNCSWEKATEDCPRTGNTYLIVGVGFVGQRLVARLLERGETKIRAFDISPHNPWEGNPHVTYIRGNVCKSEDVAKAMKGVDTVITTFAMIRFWERLEMQVERTRKVNVDGTKVVLEEAKKAGVKTFVQTSTSNVMATPKLIDAHDAKKGGPMDETCPYATRSTSHNHYSWTKAVAEKMVLDANDNKGMMTVACRPCSGVYGSKDKQIAERVFTSPILPVPYDVKIDWIYVDDVVLGLLKAEARLNERDVKVAGEAFNLVPNDDPRSYREMVETFRHYANFRVGITMRPPLLFLYIIGHFVEAVQALSKEYITFAFIGGGLDIMTPACLDTARMTFYCTNAKAKKLLNFDPVWVFEEGAQLTVATWEKEVLKRERKAKSE
eukprot:TRINITY_DN364_c0_g1_i2.p1 TRINITY_DN364_c0_g1~~TRINITY_DN364_c0_g1_i2.p1  ORF type:complete len:833 (+),score=313.97 TRINITY_DN364_c0_g1_i2:50-2500(+)